MEKAENTVVLKNALVRREDAQGRRSISLSRTERREIQRAHRIIRAVEMFLDVNTSHSWDVIAEEIGCSTRTLKTLVKSEEFERAYNEYYEELTPDPRRRASIITLNNLLPEAVQGLQQLIRSSDSDNVKLQAIKEVLKLNNIGAETDKKSDRNELAKFLKGAGVILNINIVTINPAQNEFEDEIRKQGYAHAIDGQIVEKD